VSIAASETIAAAPRNTSVPLGRLARHLALTVSAQAAILGLGAVSGILSARLLGPAGRGQLAALIVWPSTLMFLCNLGINQAIVFHTGRRRHGFSEVLTASSLIGLGQSILVLAIGAVVLPIALRHYPPGVRLLSFAFLVSAPALLLGGQPANLLQGKLDMFWFNLLRTIAPGTYALGIVLLLALNKPSLAEVVTFQIGGIVLAAFVGYALLVDRDRLHFHWSTPACKDLLRYGIRSHLSSLSYFFNQRVDQLILSLLVPPHDLGLYVVAVTVSTMVTVVPQAAGMVTLANGSNCDPDSTRKIVGHSFRVLMVWLLGTCGILYAVCPWLIVRVFGAGFAPSVAACRVLLIGTVALGLNQMLYDGARALNHPALPSYAEGVSMLITAGVLLLLVPRMSFMGAAIASSLAYTCSLVLMLILCRTRLEISLRQLIAVSEPSRA
jgi:O-antigen/teichoic acid export membrane protein